MQACLNTTVCARALGREKLRTLEGLNEVSRVRGRAGKGRAAHRGPTVTLVQMENELGRHGEWTCWHFCSSDT